MKLFVFALMVAAAQAAAIVDPKDCVDFPCLIFNDEFDFFDHRVWEHEITMAGGGNYEFEVYVNNRSISYTHDSTLFIKPDLVSNWHDEAFLSSGVMNMWGQNGRGDVCTSNQNDGCERVGTETNLINPIMSARIRSQLSFDFKFGRMEIRAQMPRGDWLWPAVWMLPTYWPYGLWPASGEIDVIECRGNDKFGDINNTYAGSTLHWGPYYPNNRYDLTTNFGQNANKTSFADDFHIWTFDWTDVDMKFYLDGELTLTVDPVTNFWDFGEFANIGDIDNIWAEAGNKMTPFDQEFYIIMNLAVGGTGGFFPDGVDPSKPWTDDSPTAFLDFWNDKDTWYPTWTEDGTTTGKIGEGAALKIDYVKVYKMTNSTM